MHPAERVARIPPVDIDAFTLTLGCRKDCLYVEKGKAERFEPEQFQHSKITSVSVPMPQQSQRNESRQRYCRNCQAIRYALASARCVNPNWDRVWYWVFAHGPSKNSAPYPCKDPAMRLDGLLSVVYSSFTIFEYASMG